MTIDLASLTAIDVHVHLEAAQIVGRRRTRRASISATAAPARDPAALAEYYRSRQHGLRGVHRGRAAVGPPQRHQRRGAGVRRRATPTSPSRSSASTRRAARRRCARRGGWSRPGWSAASSCTRRCSSSSPTTASPTRSTRCSPRRSLPVLFHTGHSGIGSGAPGGGGVRLKYGHPDADRRRGGRFPRPADHHGAPVVPLAGRGDLDLPAQADGLHRSLRLVAEVLLADARSSTPTACSRPRCCSGRTTRGSRRTAGWPTSRRSASRTRCGR